MNTPLFDSEFLQKLEYLTLIARKRFRGRFRGEHRTPRKGTSLEFHDYRPYQPGDDFRYIDWNAFSRLDRLFVKLYSAEEDLTIHILLDTSGSMAFGNPSKLDYSRRIAAALAYIGLANLDRVRAASFAESPQATHDPSRRGGVAPLFRFLESLQASGRTQFNSAIASYVSRNRHPGLAIVISDLLDPAGYQDGLKSLRFAGFDTMIIQILSEEEIEPPYSGSLELLDAETAERRRITVDRRMRDAYRDHLRHYLDGLEEFTLANGIEYLRASTAIPFEQLVLNYLRQGMYLK